MKDSPCSKELTTWDCCNLEEMMKHRGLLKETIRESKFSSKYHHCYSIRNYSRMRVYGNNMDLNVLNLKNTAAIHVNCTDLLLPAFGAVEIFYFFSSAHSLPRFNPLSQGVGTLCRQEAQHHGDSCKTDTSSMLHLFYTHVNNSFCNNYILKRNSVYKNVPAPTARN